jgi:Predicted phosphatase homologous to the C-terminal domain of histone macroH2A1
MTQEERMDYLVKYLCLDSGQYKNMHVDKNDTRTVIRSLMNIRMPKDISEDYLKIQDEFLTQESIEKGILPWREIPTVKEQFGVEMEFADKISIWRGDITRLQVDAIVNAANTQMLGCFVPCHKCIDNAIHSAAGIQLREECNQYMQMKRKSNRTYKEPTGEAVVTKGYNLPCKYVIHTVGPIVYGELNHSLRNDLHSCYRSCLMTAMEYGIRTIAFCCISTGEFHFPNDEAAAIAYQTVKDFVETNKNKFDRIIFNVFKELDMKIYKDLLSIN